MARSESAARTNDEANGSLEPGVRIGRYEILRLLGSGSMGTVYLARDPLLGRNVAVKTLASDFPVADSELRLLRRRFLNEARSAGAMHHPGLVTIYDVIEDEEGRIAIAMEYVEGQSLREWLNRPDPLPFEWIVEVIGEIAETLDAAHAGGIIHRDIKPANILLARGEQVKIADFGIASLRGDDLARELNALGTPNYLAPERILGQPADHRSDVYALGVILYEMLTRRLPYQGESIGELVSNVAQEPYQDPSVLRPDLPAPLLRVLERALEKSPDRRYQSAGELADDLEAAMLQQAKLSDTVPSTLFEELDLVDPDDSDRPEITVKVVPDEMTADETASAEEDPEELVLDEIVPEPADAGADEGPSEVLQIDPALPEIAEEELEQGEPERVEPPPETTSRFGDTSGVVIRTEAGKPAKSLRAVAFSALAIFAVAALALSIGALGRGTDDPVRAAEALEQRRLEYQALVAEGARMLDHGELVGAERILHQADALMPDGAAASLLRSQIAQQRRDRLAALDQAEVSALFMEARDAFDRQDLAGTELALAALFELDEDHEGGLALASAVAAVEAALARPVPRPRPSEPVEEDEPEELPGVEEPIVEPVEAVPVPLPVDPFGTLHIEFLSKRPKGVLTIYAGGEQLLRRPFRFFERRGLVRRRGVAGGFEDEERLAAGDLELRVYLTLPGQSAQSQTMTGSLAAGAVRTLDVRVDEAGMLTAALR